MTVGPKLSIQQRHSWLLARKISDLLIEVRCSGQGVLCIPYMYFIALVLLLYRNLPPSLTTAYRPIAPVTELFFFLHYGPSSLGRKCQFFIKHSKSCGCHHLAFPHWQFALSNKAEHLKIPFLLLFLPVLLALLFFSPSTGISQKDIISFGPIFFTHDYFESRVSSHLPSRTFISVLTIR